MYGVLLFQCLDFAATAHLIHLIVCTIYAGFPTSLTWWLLNLACMALMSVIGEFICMRTELKAIPVSVASVKSTVWQCCLDLLWWMLFALVMQKCGCQSGKDSIPRILRERCDKHQGTCFLVDPDFARWGLERTSKAPRAERGLF